MNSAESEFSIKELFSQGKIIDALGGYILQCKNEDTHGNSNTEKNKNTHRAFPNLAGFCRYLKIGTRELCQTGVEYPRMFDRILAVLEDEALNSPLSAAILGTYLKKRLGYDSSPIPEKDFQEQIVFEHDIFSDGE